MAKMTEKDKQDWNSLYEYIRTDILNYGIDKALPKTLVLRLKGLSEGKFMANKNAKSYGKYSFEVILLAFKFSKADIMIGIRDKDKFQDENHMINYMMVIVEKKVNDVYDILKRKKDCENRVQNVNIQEASKGKYIKKSKKSNNNSLIESLW